MNKKERNAMFKIHDDKVYFVAETPNINKVIEMSFIEFSRQASIGSLMTTKRWMMPFTNVVGLS